MCVQNIWLFVSKIGVFGHFLEIASLDFTDFAYFNRQEWYVADPGGCSLQKNICVFYGLRKLVSKLIFCLQIQYLDFNSKAFFRFAYYDRQQWFLAGTGGFSRQNIFLGPNWAHFGPVSKLFLSQNSLSWL